LFLPVYKRYVKDLHKKKRKFTEAKDVADYLRPLYLDTNNERIYAVCLDADNRMIACRVISDGDIDSSAFDSRKLAAIVLEVKAKKVILSHNHPNGSLVPSPNDCRVTAMAFELLKLLKVQLVDHIIVTDKSYFSMSRSPGHTHLLCGARPLSRD
jgi:DNA repair protein RadC